MKNNADDHSFPENAEVFSSSNEEPKIEVRKRVKYSTINSKHKDMVPKVHDVSYSEADRKHVTKSVFKGNWPEHGKKYDSFLSSILVSESAAVNSDVGNASNGLSDDEVETTFVTSRESSNHSPVDRFIPHGCHEDDDVNDTAALLPKPYNPKKCKSSEADLVHMSKAQSSTNTSTGSKHESALTIALQISFPFLMAGMGMVAAGLVLDKVQHWEVFEKVPEIFILVPALLGLKGNLEMTLASRLSTYANRGFLDEEKKRFQIIIGNIILVEAQAMVIAFLASLVAMVLGWIPDGKWETNHAIILCCGSLLTGAIASGILGVVMILVIVCSRKLGINPDNVATPIAASLGDLITLSLLSLIVKGFYSVLYEPSTFWIGPAVIALFVVLTPLFLWLAHRNEYTHDVVRHGWEPVIAAMAISSTGGFILDFAVSQNKGIAVFAPVINGVGGNLVAVQASRISTYLHSSGFPLGTLPHSERSGCINPCYVFCGSGNPHAPGSRVMLFAVIPGQLIFLLTIQALKAGHTTITPQFVAVYMLVVILQVAILLHVCNVLVLRLWRKGDDPDNCAIPYLTALGDLLGTGLLSLGFLFLWLVGDRDADVGD